MCLVLGWVSQAGNHIQVRFDVLIRKVMVHDKRVESGVAIGSFLTAVAFAFTALAIRENHNLFANDLMMVAQFLMLTATIFGLDYKITSKISQVLRKEEKK